MKDELICNGVSLNLSEGIAVPLNFSIADVKDIKKRARKFSKEIKLQGTMDNCAFFRSFYNFTVTDGAVNFDATQRTNAVLIRQGLEVFGNGILKLNSVTITDGKIVFSVNLFSETVDYFLLLSNIKVSELDWSDYDHILNRVNIKASWTAAVGSGYYYPLIERGNGRVSTIWNTTDIVPYVYAREVILKMYAYLGLTINSAWLDTNRIKNVLFGYGGGDYITNSITPLDLASRLVDLTAGNLTYNSIQNVYWGTSIINGVWTPSLNANIATFGQFELDSTNITFTTTSDTLLQYDNGKITVQKSGNYNFLLTGSLDVTLDTGILNFIARTGDQLILMRNGQTLLLDQLLGGNTNPITQAVSFNINLSLQSGDEISLRYVAGGVLVSRTLTTDNDVVQYALTTSTPLNVELTCTDTTITDGGTVNLSKFIPDMLCSDFLVGFLRQFNVYTSDPNLNGEVDLLPFTDYYSGTDVFDDISKDVDYSRDIEVLPISNEYGKTFSFKYKTNKDRDNVVYFEEYGDNYGDYTFDQGSYFAKGQEKIELPWSNIIPYQINNGILVPRFISQDNGGAIKANKGAARLCMRTGLKNGAWTFRNTDDPTQWEALATYPNIHHFDNFDNPTFDLNFQLVDELFYAASIVTTVNSYSEFYSVFINEITNRAGQLNRLYVKWSTQDVKSKDFSRLQMIEGALFRLNRIIDFDEDAQATTKIELIKVLEAKKRRVIQIIEKKRAIKGKPFISSPVGVGEDVAFMSTPISNTAINSQFIQF